MDLFFHQSLFISHLSLCVSRARANYNHRHRGLFSNDLLLFAKIYRKVSPDFSREDSRRHILREISRKRLHGQKEGIVYLFVEISQKLYPNPLRLLIFSIAYV